MDNHNKPQPPLCTTCKPNIFTNKNPNVYAQKNPTTEVSTRPKKNKLDLLEKEKTPRMNFPLLQSFVRPDS